MNTIKAALFEGPLPLVAALVGVQAVTLIVWRIRRTRTTRAVAIVPLALTAAVLLLSWLVVTDRERIALAYQAVASDVAAGSTEALALYLDEDALVNPEGRSRRNALSKAEVLSLVRRHLEELKVREIRLPQMEITVAGNEAESTVTARIVNDSPATGGMPFVLSWDVTWIKRPGGWRIHRVVAIPTRLGLQGGQ